MNIGIIVMYSYTLLLSIINVTFEGVELGRKNVSDMFYCGELENEIPTRKKVKEWKFKSDDDSEKYMTATDEERASTLYPHTVSRGCTDRGVP